MYPVPTDTGSRRPTAVSRPFASLYSKNLQELYTTLPLSTACSFQRKTTHTMTERRQEDHSPPSKLPRLSGADADADDNDGREGCVVLPPASGK